MPLVTHYTHCMNAALNFTSHNPTLEMLRDLTGFDDPVELFDALDSNEKGEVGGIPAESGLGRLRIGKDKKSLLYFVLSPP